MEVTESDNQYINYYKGNTKVTQEDLEKIMKKENKQRLYR